jgi:ElaB/YqjD/DUF883 family membrane-anchored ribosome-binding protein
MELANVAVVVSATNRKGFDMADTNTSNQGGAAAPEVTFDADPTLEAQTGGAEVAFEAADAGSASGESEAKRSATQQLKDEAAKLGTQAADRAREYAGQGKERATSALDEVAKMFTSAAEDVDARLGAEYGRYARSAADGITGFADALRGKEVDDLIDDAAAFVRKSPVIAVGTAAAVGFVLARLIKSGIDAASDLGEQSTAAETTDA